MEASRNKEGTTIERWVFLFRRIVPDRTVPKGEERGPEVNWNSATRENPEGMGGGGTGREGDRLKISIDRNYGATIFVIIE